MDSAPTNADDMLSRDAQASCSSIPGEYQAGSESASVLVHMPRTDATHARTYADDETTAESSSSATRAGGLNESIAINGPTWVYHCMCSHGATLYVGVANDPSRRFRQHSATKPWWREVDIIICDLYDSRKHALAVESHYIRNGNLTHMHNVQGWSDGPPTPYKWVQRRYWSRIDGGLTPADFYVLPDQSTVKIAGTS